KTFADAQKYEATLAGTGAGSTVSIYPTGMNNGFGTKFKLIMGYKGSAEGQLAGGRGGGGGDSAPWAAGKGAHPDWRAKKKNSIQAQFALTPHPDLKDIPTAVSLARNDEERQIVSAIVAAADIGLAFFTTPGVPADRLTALRRAFDATMKDKDFLDEVEKLKLTAAPMKGEDLQQLIKKVSDLSPTMLEKVRHAYTANQPGDKGARVSPGKGKGREIVPPRVQRGQWITPMALEEVQCRARLFWGQPTRF